MRIFELKSLFLLFAILLTILSSPFNHRVSFEWGALILGLLWAILVGYGGYRISENRRWLIAYSSAITWVFLIVGLEIVTQPHLVLIFLKNIGIIFIQSCALYVALRYALSTYGGPLDRTIAGICGYFLLGMIWSNFFVLIQYTDGAAFQSTVLGIEAIDDVNLLYFSMVNLTTLGYGDIVPVNEFARIVSTLESAFGTLYLAVMVATLVSELRVSKSRSI